MAEHDVESSEREELRERIQAWTETPLNLLGLLLLVVLVVEFALDVPPGWDRWLNSLNWFIYAVFTLDFLVQFLLAHSKQHYLRRNWIAAISVLLPALRVFRALRAVRALRGLRLVRVITATNRGTRSLSEVLRGHQFGRVFGLTVTVAFVGAAALAYFEGAGTSPSDYGEALWWSVALISTVGSDFQPETLEGRVVTILLLVWGLGVFGFITAAVASYFVGQDAAGTSDPEMESLHREVAELKLMLAEALGRQSG